MIADPPPVGMIGLGLMGTALAARLIEAGVPLIGFDIDPTKRKAFGGEAAGSAGQIAAPRRTIIIAVFDASQVDAVLGELRGPGIADVMICTTTCAPGEISELAGRASALG